MLSFRDVGPFGRHTAHEPILAAIRQAILSGELPGGTRLVQADLAAKFGVSNTPVREAMRQLATEGLIQFDSFRGAVVHTPTLDEVREVYEARLLLEPVVMRKTVERITPAEIEQARELQQKMTTVDDVGTWAVLNRQFHGVLMDASRSPRLATIVGWLEDAATAQVALSIKADLGRMAHGDDEHVQILDAVELGDADRVEDLVRRHLMATVHAVEEAQDEAPGDVEG